MSAVENRAVIRRIYEEGYDRGEERVFDELYVPGFVHHGKVIHDIPRGAEGEKASMRRFREAIPDVRFRIVDEVAEGDRVAVHLRISGTPVAAFGPIVPTGGPIEIRALALFRFEDGKVAEEWFYGDGGNPR